MCQSRMSFKSSLVTGVECLTCDGGNRERGKMDDSYKQQDNYHGLPSIAGYRDKNPT